ncbi:uncharacterized protein LOC135416752 [Pseudopipra pipra]|uniref:uncharacterized protein LOC135416752 n=1 Tax=Pseudopipra pipra TaxID=415032 RepID=UPI00313A228B
MAIHLLGLLSTEDPRWELPALEFLVEVLDYLDARRCHSSVEQILSRHLQSQCPERRRLALRGRMVLWMDLSMAQSICSLSQHLLELLPDEDGELVVMTLSVFVNMLRDKDIRALISTAPKLAEALRPLFENLSSFRFFQTVMEVLVEGGTQPLEMQMHQTLVLWFFLQYDEHQCVAEVSTCGLWGPRGRGWAASCPGVLCRPSFGPSTTTSHSTCLHTLTSAGSLRHTHVMW